jgi:hypothetical protein
MVVRTIGGREDDAMRFPIGTTGVPLRRGGLAVLPGATVAVEDVTALTWRLEGRSGVSLRALAITTRADLGVVKGG